MCRLRERERGGELTVSGRAACGVRTRGKSGGTVGGEDGYREGWLEEGRRKGLAGETGVLKIERSGSEEEDEEWW